MKIQPEHQVELERLLEVQAGILGHESIASFITAFRASVAAGLITPHRKCEATRILNCLLCNEALTFVCDTIYPYANDDHIAAFYRHLLRKHE